MSLCRRGAADFIKARWISGEGDVGGIGLFFQIARQALVLFGGLEQIQSGFPGCLIHRHTVTSEECSDR